MKNYLGQAVGLTGMVMVMLLLLSFFSKETSIAGINIRRMDILSDIKNEAARPEIDTAELAALDSLAMAESVTDTTPVASMETPIEQVDSSRFGYIIEDYSYQQDGLQRFYQAVDSIRLAGHKTRVAFFGDSFIEGDIFLGDLRDTLQSLWGGAGVGFVPMTSEVARFRRTYLQRFEGWRNFSIIHNDGNTLPLGIDGHIYLPGPDAWSFFEGTTQYACRNTAAWSDVRLFYKAAEGVNFVWQIKGGNPYESALAASKGRISVWEHTENQRNITAFKCRFPQDSGLNLYGASLESGPGVYFDNFSVRGNSGGKLCLIQPGTMQAFQHYQKYDLIILQFGLNAVTNSLRNINWYRAELEKTFKHVRESFPGTPVLVLSVPDRGGKVDGELTTMISVPYIVQMQRDLARRHGFMFYDFYRGMGGHGSMVRLAEMRHPTLVNKDYTHLTHEGGRLMGLKFAELLLKTKSEIGL